MNNSNGRKSGLLLEVDKNSHPYLLLELLMKYPKGLAIKDIEKETGLSSNTIRFITARFRSWFTNISGKKSGDIIRLQYSDVKGDGAPIIIQQTTTAAPVNKKQMGQAIPQQSAPSSSVQQTDIVWAPAPAIPDLKEKYPYFIPPVWYDRMKSKVCTHSKNVSLEGPPGIGKSVAFECLAAKEFMPLVSINGEAGLRAHQLIGRPTDLGRFEVAQFATAVVRGWWAKLDEVNGADPDAILFLNSIIAPPHTVVIHGRAYPVHPQFRLCITYNAGLIGTKPVPQSLKDRFYPFKIAFPDKIQLKKMLKSNGLPEDDSNVEKMIAFAMAIAAERNKGGRLKFDITIRRLLDAWTDILDGYSCYDALYNSCISSIDSIVDSNAVIGILDTVVGKKAVP